MIKQLSIFSPSLISIVDPLNVERDVKKLIKAGFMQFHVDVMDLNFVPNITMGFDEVNRLAELGIQRDIHLMVQDVKTALDRLNLSKKDTVLFHVEDPIPTHETIELIKSKSQVGLVINPNTPIEKLKPYVEHINKILFMAVQPGFGGQDFITNTYERVEGFISFLKPLNLPVVVGVDGGVGVEQIQKLYLLGVQWFVIGKQIFQTDIKTDAKRFFKTMVEKGIHF